MGEMHGAPPAAAPAQPAEPQDEDTQDPTSETMVEEEEGELPFQGKVLVVQGFEGEAVQELTAHIEELGGSVICAKSRRVPDYAVVPLFGWQVQITVNEIATNAWLQMCLEQDALLPLDSNELFRPIEAKIEEQPLKNCVLSISGYTGTERDSLMHIAEELGGSCQEFFVKRANKNQSLKANSHLIVNAPEGSKYTAAKKWGIPAVHKQWLFDCAKSGKLLDAEDYFVEKLLEEEQEDTVVKDETLAAGEARTPGPGLSTSVRTPATTVKEQSWTPKQDASIAKNVQLVDAGEMEVDEPAEEDDHPLNKSDKENQELPPPDQHPIPTDNVPQKPATPVATPGALQKETPVNKRVRALMSEGSSNSPKVKTPQTNTKADGQTPVTPGQFLRPDKAYQPKWDFSEALAMLESPAGNGNRRTSLPLEDLYSKHIQLAIKQTSSDTPSRNKDGTPMRAKSDSQESFLREPQGPLKGVVIAVSKKLGSKQSEYNNIASSMGADYRWTYDNSCTHFIFQGRANDTSKEYRIAKEQGKKIVSPHWLMLCQEQECHVDESLFPHTYNPNMSLSISTTETPVRSTRRSTRTKEQRRKTEPPTPVATRTRAVKKEESPAKMEEVEENEKEKSKELDRTQSDDEIAFAAAEVDEGDNGEKGVNLVSGLQNLMAATRTYSKNRRKSRRYDSTEEPSLTDTPEKKSSRPSSRQSKHDDSSDGRSSSRSSLRLRNPNPLPETQTEASQMVEVTWDDPMAREQQEMLASELAKESESFSPKHLTSDEEHQTHASSDDDPLRSHLRPKRSEPAQAEVENRIPTPEPVTIAFPTLSKTAAPSAAALPLDHEEHEEEESPGEEEPEQKRIFLLSGLPPNERDEYGALIEKLGGEMFDGGHFDIRCTHLIVGVPTRNEKYLASVATGKWVLHKSYLQACRDQGAFVQEESHAWGGEGTAALMKTMSSLQVKLARCAYTWRNKIQQQQRDEGSCTGAFNGWQVALITEKKREEGFRRLLEAGGAKIKATSPPIDNLDTITHAFMDLNKAKVTMDLEALVKAQVPCLKPEFIAEYLMNYPVDQNDFYIAEVQHFYGEKPRKRKASSAAATPSKKSKR